MIRADEAVALFEKKMPSRKVIAAAGFDSTHYLFEAPESENEVDYNDPYFLMDKNTGEISGYLPTNELAKFHAAFRDNSIALDGG